MPVPGGRLFLTILADVRRWPFWLKVKPRDFQSRFSQQLSSQRSISGAVLVPVSFAMAFQGFSESAGAAETSTPRTPILPAETPEMILPSTLGGFTKTPVGFGEVLACLGADEDTETETFLGLSTEDMTEALGNAVMSGVTLSPIQKAGVAVFIRKIFRAAGFDEPPLGGSVASKPLPAPVAQPPPAAPANSERQPAAAPAPTAPQQEGEMVALSGVTDQSSKMSARLISFDELFKLRSHYSTVCGRAPPDAYLPSAEQLSCLQTLLASGRTPYVDFAVWNSHGARLKHFTRAEAAVFVGGAFITRTVEGPKTFEAWEQSWMLFATAMVSLGAASPGTLAM